MGAAILLDADSAAIGWFFIVVGASICLVPMGYRAFVQQSWRTFGTCLFAFWIIWPVFSRFFFGDEGDLEVYSAVFTWRAAVAVPIAISAAFTLALDKDEPRQPAASDMWGALGAAVMWGLIAAIAWDVAAAIDAIPPRNMPELDPPRNRVEEAVESGTDLSTGLRMLAVFETAHAFGGLTGFVVGLVDRLARNDHVSG